MPNAPVNPLRGEASLVLGKQAYRLRPSFEALAAAEQEIGSLISLVERAGAGAVTLSDIVILLHHCARAGGHDVGRGEFAEAVMSAGLAQTVAPLKAILAGLMTGE